MAETGGTGREGTSGWWGPALRALRLRSNMKQDDAASRLRVSQSNISRLENGVITPSPDIIARLRTLLHSPVHRPLVDQLRAIVRHAPHAVALLALNEGAVHVVESSARFRHAGLPFNTYTPGSGVADLLGQRVADLVQRAVDCGAFEGEIACLEQVWEAVIDGDQRYFHSVQTPVFTGAEWMVHSATALISRTVFERFTAENDGTSRVHHF